MKLPHDRTAELFARRQLALAAVLLSAACSKAATAPAAPTVPADVRGRIVQTLSGEPVPGARIAMGTASVAAQDDGTFAFVGGAAVTGLATVTAPGYLTRQLRLDLSRPRVDVAIDLISEAAPFHLARFREFARDAFDHPGAFKSLRRWRATPRFYIRTVHDDTGAEIPPPFIAAAREIIRNSVVELSGGVHRDPIVETGAEARADAPGWVRVFFRQQLPTATAHGQATVGGESGWVGIRFDAQSPRPSNNFPDRCLSYELQVLEHELTHTMGFYHTSIWAERSAFHSLTGCTGGDRLASARHFAAIVYAREPGNADIDADGTTVNQQAGIPATVSCDATHLRAASRR